MRLAARQMRLFGPVLGFTLADKTAAETFLTSSKLVTDATSFGGISTTAERRVKWGGDDVSEGFIRMSAGCEAIEDLIEDIAGWRWMSVQLMVVEGFAHELAGRGAGRAAADCSGAAVYLSAAGCGRGGCAGARGSAGAGASGGWKFSGDLRAGV